MNIGYEAKRVFHNKTGLGNYSRDLVRILATYYPQNNYFLYNPKHSDKNLFKINNENIFERNPNTHWSKKLSAFWRQKSVTKNLIEDKIEIFHGLSGEIPIGLKKTNIKSVVTIHDLIFMRYPHLYSFFDRKIHFFKFKYAAKNSDIVVAVSQQTKNDIISFFKIHESKIKVIYQGCNEVYKQFFSEIEIKNTIKKYNLPNDYILNVGTIEKRKNLLIILKSITKTDKNLVVIGKKTAYFKEVWSFIVAHNLEKQVFFLKNLTPEEMAIVYQKSTLFVYPSIFEGFGIPIIEALYSKTPVITSVGSCFFEAGGSNSIYVNPENSNELREAINSVWDNKSKQTEMKEKGFKFVQKFNDEIFAQKWQNLYRSLL